MVLLYICMYPLIIYCLFLIIFELYKSGVIVGIVFCDFFSHHSIMFLNFIHCLYIVYGSFIFTEVLNYFVIIPQFYSVILTLQIWMHGKNGHLCCFHFLIMQIMLLWTFSSLVNMQEFLWGIVVNGSQIWLHIGIIWKGLKNTDTRISSSVCHLICLVCSMCIGVFRKAFQGILMGRQGLGSLELQLWVELLRMHISSIIN